MGRELLARELVRLPSVRAVVADRGYQGLAALCAKLGIRLDITRSPAGASAFVPIAPPL